MPLRTFRIDVSAKIIADISSGIYRTPANALKELISNSFDADAKTAIITTNYPNFDVMTCSDYGEGMTISQFEQIMKRIGGSNKRAAESSITPLGRPIIGKIGIGVLAVAQICRKFTVISSTKEDKDQFEAIIDLKPFHDQDAYKLNLRDQKVNIGEYKVEEIEKEENGKSYTRIILEEIDEGFKSRLLDLPNKAVAGFKFKKTDPETFDEFIDWFKDKKAKDVPEYLRLLWELALISPIPYPKAGPVPNSRTMEIIKNRLLKYDFNVVVDGIKLVKPILFPYAEDAKNKHFDWKTYDVSYGDVVGNSRLKFSGYIYHQNKAIVPPELRGLIIRIRNVGIGGYDKSFLGFPQSVGPIITGMTGELYVEEGLEDALNIDRNSFRETAPHYIRLQEVIFDSLSRGREKGGILADARYRSKIVQDEKRDDLLTGEYDTLEKLIAKVYGRSLKIERIDTQSDVPVRLDFDNSRIEIYPSCPIFPRSKKLRRFYEKISIFHELSTYGCAEKPAIDKIFYSFLKEKR